MIGWLYLCAHGVALSSRTVTKTNIYTNSQINIITKIHVFMLSQGLEKFSLYLAENSFYFSTIVQSIYDKKTKHYLFYI